MTRYILIRCNEIDAVAGKPYRGVRTQLSFTIPQFQAEIIAEFIPSQTAAAIKRAMKLIDLAINGATKAELTEPLDKYLKPAKRSRSERKEPGGGVATLRNIELPAVLGMSAADCRMVTPSNFWEIARWSGGEVKVSNPAAVIMLGTARAELGDWIVKRPGGAIVVINRGVADEHLRGPF